MTRLAKAALGKGFHLTLQGYLHEDPAQEDLYGVKTTVSSSRVKMYRFMPMDKTMTYFYCQV